VAQRRILHLVQPGDRLRPDAPHQYQSEEREERIEHLRPQHLHQYPRRQRPDTGTDAIGDQQHGRQRHPPLALYMVIGKRHGQRVQAELQQ